MAVDFLGALGAGSDIDTKSLVQSLVDAEKMPRETSLNQKLTKAEVKISAFGEVTSALGLLATAFERLNDAADFESASLSVSGNKTTDGTDAFTAELTTGASVGSNLSVRVDSIAEAERWISTGVDALDTELNSGGAFTITVAGDPEIVLTSSIDASEDTFSNTGHGYATGDVLYYEDNGTPIGGLSNQTSYFVIRVDADTFKLAATADDATNGTAIDLTSTGNDAQTLKVIEEVSLDAGSDLTDVVSEINQTVSLGTATLIDRGESAGSQRYVVSIEGDLGSDNAFTVETTASSGVYPNFSNNQAASDAEVTINGVSIFRASNEINDSITGVKLSLFGTSAGTGKLSIGRDTTIVEANIRNLVEVYNNVDTILDGMTDADDTSEFGGVFSGDGGFRLLKSTIKSMFIGESSTATDNLSYLSDVGISISQSGQLEIDDDRLSTVLATNYEDLVTLFSADTNNQSKYGEADRGIAGDALVQLDQMLSRDGMILTRTAGIEKNVEEYGEQLEDLDRRMQQVYERYLAQFTAMETAIDQLNSTKEFLTTALENLPFNNKNK